MTWVEIGVVLAAAVMTIGAGAIVILVSGEGMQAASLQAEQKALALFRPWLSPEQAQQYNSLKHFEVIGSDTGTRYRIRHGKMMNIEPWPASQGSTSVTTGQPKSVTARFTHQHKNSRPPRRLRPRNECYLESPWGAGGVVSGMAAGMTTVSARAGS
jgi:hypothetical protein